MLLRRARDPARQEGRFEIGPNRLPLDASVVPWLLFLVARDLLAFDPPRVLAWRLLHDPRLALPGWLAPALSGDADRDPIALLLAGAAIFLALAYVAACWTHARPPVRAGLIAAAAIVLVVAPTLAFVAMGATTGRPYGQDGGVVQLPLAIDKLLAGESPYGADYSASILGRQARVSDFWSERGGNPILRHHAYLPGTHLLMLPFHLVGSAGGIFDPRFVTLLALAAAAMLGARLMASAERKLTAAAIVLLNPLLYWQQIFGANDIVIAALLLAAVLLGEKGRPLAAAAVIGLACATKQLAWPFAPFLLLHLSQASSWRELAGPASRRVLALTGVTVAVFAAIVLPVAALDFRAFWGDIVVYNVGLPGGDNYPLGGTPGFGFANFLIYFGAVNSLQDHVSFTRFYLLLIPLGLMLAGLVLRERGAAAALAAGGTALLLSLYFSRVVHPNYLILAATLLPIAALMGMRCGADVVVVPLLILALAVEVVQGRVMQATWEDAIASRLPAHLDGVWLALAPRAGPHLTEDPLGLAWGAVAAGLAIVFLTAGVLGAGPRARMALIAVAAVAVMSVPAVVAMRVSGASGVYRVQDAWAAALRSAGAPGTMREAWSTSFRRDPPAVVPPGAGVSIGGHEPRLLALAMIPVIAALVFGLVRPENRPLVLGVALLAPPIALGTVFGSGALVVLAALGGAGWGFVRGSRVLAAAGLVLAVIVSVPALTTASGIRAGVLLFLVGTGSAWWLAALLAGIAFVPGIPSRSGTAPGDGRDPRLNGDSRS